MKILLVHLQIHIELAYNSGLAYISSVLKQGGHDVSCSTLQTISDIRALCQKVEREEPGIVAFSVMTLQSQLSLVNIDPNEIEVYAAR